MKRGNRWLRWLGRILLVLLAVVAAYVLYVILSYRRIPDHVTLDPTDLSDTSMLPLDQDYTVVTQNVGFGAYTPDFTFFMDGGTQSWAKDKETVIADINMAAETVQSLHPDFVLFQEVDTDSTRSYHVDQYAQLCSLFPDFNDVFAINYHSAFLMYPLTQPHGKSNSGLLTLSRAHIRTSERRSLRVASGFSKFLDLDRCYSFSRISLLNGKDLVLYNVHLSAYGGSDAIRSSQITQLVEDMRAEYRKGNYCVCGGDFNHDFTGDSTIVLGGGEISSFGWAQPFPAELLPEGISRVMNYDDPELIPTCRNCDVPYGPDCQTFVLDGFLVTDNVIVKELHNVDTGFAYSDHNPVVMTFTLK